MRDIYEASLGHQRERALEVRDLLGRVRRDAIVWGEEILRPHLTRIARQRLLRRDAIVAIAEGQTPKEALQRAVGLREEVVDEDIHRGALLVHIVVVIGTVEDEGVPLDLGEHSRRIRRTLSSTRARAGREREENKQPEGQQQGGDTM